MVRAGVMKAVASHRDAALTHQRESSITAPYCCHLVFKVAHRYCAGEGATYLLPNFSLSATSDLLHTSCYY